MKQFKTGIIGCGKVSDFHARAYKALPESDFTACCGHTEEKTKIYAAKYGIKPYTDIRKMIEENDLDVVSICTPQGIHAENVEAAASMGCDIIIEKPLATTVEDCDRIIEAGEKYNVKIETIVQRRFYRPCMRIKKAIDDGKLGTPILGTVNVIGWRDEKYYRSDPWRGTWKGEGGGVMTTQATHQIDLLLWYMGEPEEVYGIAKNFNHPYIEVEDTAVAIVKFKNGGIGNLVMTNSINPALYGKVAVYGSNGAAAGVQTDGGQMFIAGVNEIAEAPYNDIWTITGEAENLKEMQESDRKFWESIDYMDYCHREQIQGFFDTIKENRTPFVTARDGKGPVALYNAVYECERTGKPVKITI